MPRGEDTTASAALVTETRI